MKMYVIYGLVETRPGHRFEGMIRYVGQTQNLDKRVWHYRRAHGNNRRMNFWLVKCPDFEVRTLGSCIGLKAAWALEIEEIARYKTFESSHGLNYRAGGQGGDMLSVDSRQKISETLRLRYKNDPTMQQRIVQHMIVLSSTPEWKERKRHEMLTWFENPENHQLISERTKAAMTPEAKAKMRRAAKKRYQDPAQKIKNAESLARARAALKAKRETAHERT